MIRRAPACASLLFALLGACARAAEPEAEPPTPPPLVEDRDRAPLDPDAPAAEPDELSADDALRPGLPAPPPVPPEPPQSDVTGAKGGTHLIGIGGVIGTGAAIVALAGALTRFPQLDGDLVLSGAGAGGLFALFLGGGLAAARLLDPTPPAAWGSFWAGTAGAGIGLKLAIDARGGTFGSVSSDLVLLASALGYLAGSAIYLALPDAQTLSWKEFWVTVGPGALVGGVLAAVGLTQGFSSTALIWATIVSPVAVILALRLAFAFWQPFDPWVDDLKPPFRAQPIIALAPTGASVGIAGSW